MSFCRENRKEIGGYFGLELQQYQNPFLDCLMYQSARAAIRAIIESAKFEYVYLPYYVCDSVVQAVEATGVGVRFYSLTSDLMPAGVPVELDAKSALIYVNYFGLNQSNVGKLLVHYSPRQIVVDQSHALFAERTSALAEIYSPRKFVGLPDGGLMRAQIQIDIPDQEDEDSLARTTHLFKRYAYSARSGYEDFNRARRSLADTTPKSMSKLTRQLMGAINWPAVRQKRNINYWQMSKLLSAYNDWPSSADANEEIVPICYPFVVKGYDMTTLKSTLADEYNIFTPTYWPEVASRLREGSIEEMLMKETLFLPIDQRMGGDDIINVSRLVLKLLNR